MKKLLKKDYIFGMANLSTKRSGLGVKIWSEEGGLHRNTSHNNTPRVKVGNNQELSISIESNPKILAGNLSKFKHSEQVLFFGAIEYVGRNYDIFLLHYNSKDEEFDDNDLFNELRNRGEYK